ncbi:hypothetical protein Saro_0497 [Novosphingobium aromaticivorans DSM 12444]|uniref:Uncharacterized protein n=1 Tax=Novosphingobium aromaticivorans (strain ATCC 700278 / DSM 12444 / CCUG 56034 / CIP 105152 / NBRC 16084 / F199) TaxID=279238 RepID=Q2GB28_NOVAD|nr:hypothetical protein [Novosphingobium aromaticivorans]ABD24945.1 hypothetical protein Saro_0497 [Novosphingobium aromaticivorans DSM 12444]SCY94564.1 hypothetical protein SAMN05660666_03809 [Novosphingobium aromaticivorans]
MSYEQTGSAWLGGFAHDNANPDNLNQLALWCEELTSAEQRAGFERILREISDLASGRGEAASQWISLLADSGAFESAAIAMIPQSAIYTGGRMKDGSFVAQVILDGGVGAHSRNAQSISMAWLAALLRALARRSVENRTRNAH